LFFVSLALILLLAVAGGILLAQGLILEGSASYEWRPFFAVVHLLQAAPEEV
jgi:hypothetical protein